MNTDHVAVVDLGYGDAGKGTVVDALCGTGPVRAVLRFNGGAQAAHNVVTPEGRHHTFAQFGSGTFHGVPTHLTRFVVVDPLALAAEAASLGNPFHLLTVDADALLVTPWHKAANQVRERRRGEARHGSCGMGIGQTMEYALGHPDAPRAGSPDLRARLAAVRDRLTCRYGPLDAPPLDDVVEAFRGFQAAVTVVDSGYTDRLLRSGRCVFEGAQGVLLDEWRGWHPYTTWSTTTFDNVAALCDSFTRLGVVRTYTTRHGAGPFVTQAPLDLPEAHNGVGEWQGAFRVGHFDAVAHRYAVEVAGGVDALAITHLDAPGRCPSLRVCSAYEVDGARVDRIVPGRFRDLEHQAAATEMLGRARPLAMYRPESFAGEIGKLLGAPVEVESWGPGREDKRFAGSLFGAVRREPAVSP
ncbi:adenylosuccinate synthetase [Actinoplanes sp. TFC3]|uniref:adenylosuccinate synthetase n=1 Tax=Actinoplanes sp. TFC3 TaxID=1710355 RepID=UPI000834E2B6|nr:adenylosuccinate synthetase [Actinoplanes sp. TFC3]